MNWRTYYHNLNPLEVRLFENGMFTLMDEGNVMNSPEFRYMVKILTELNTTRERDSIQVKIITEEQVNDYLDSPDKYEKLYDEKIKIENKKKKLWSKREDGRKHRWKK